ncbi:unnamed protein product [Oppiella nova]|uniref:Uncharacterized protein n=1 Tax=Oppiella nova TaxID=334625 RepID=A0A7R9MAF8_9ACAR|nr:unnamed protein product [Oppiella nova]CAG2173700.1 unnamed protein product [Oppiella nova]
MLKLIFIISVSNVLKQATAVSLIDKNTGEELPIETNRYYSVQNQKTSKFLIWFGRNGTIAEGWHQSQRTAKYYHIFSQIADQSEHWYKMSHHFGSHVVKVTKAPVHGYYLIYDRDCGNGDNPIGDLDDHVKSVSLVDKNTGEELPIKSNTYYSIQNHKTQKYLIWFGKNGTVSDAPDSKQGRFWHTFTLIANQTEHWYKMNHYFGSHIVKLSKAHEDGYYQIYNKNCYNGDNPNSDSDEFGNISCLEPKTEGDHQEFHWKFSEKPYTTLQKVGIIDINTNKKLPIKTYTDYSLQNQKTSRYLIWGPNAGAVNGPPDPKNDTWWHNFTFLTTPTPSYYRMIHGVGAVHVVHVSTAPVSGYYRFYNKDCPESNGSSHPNSDYNSDGYIWCDMPTPGQDDTNYNWKFTARPKH